MDKVYIIYKKEEIGRSYSKHIEMIPRYIAFDKEDAENYCNNKEAYSYKEITHSMLGEHGLYKIYWEYI